MINEMLPILKETQPKKGLMDADDFGTLDIMDFF
ncbi:hypothetical protein IMSAGC007_00024 [Lachnospiraceae bacterium]|jgi:hypothetical protein|nr:hypothetical protein IMSAGC007_00024 [Lachnospiraceae bacterium]